MWDLVPSKEIRKFKIIDTLYHANDWVTIGNLATITSSSERSIKYDLEELKDSVDDINGKIITASKGVMIHLPSNIGLDYFERSVYKNNAAFTLLEYIFFNENILDKEMEKLLFISPSSLNRLITRIKEALKNYGITLTTNPIKINGDERLVRSFYSAYFNERYTIDEWPFPNINQDLLDILQKKLHNYLGSSSNVVDYQFLRVQVAVSISREMRGYPTILPYSVYFENREGLYKEALNEMSHINQDFNLSPMETQSYLNQLANWKFYFSATFINGTTPEYESIQTNMNEIRGVIERLSALFNLPTFDNIHLIYQLNNTIVNYELFSLKNVGSDYLLFNPRDYFLNQRFKEEYPLFYSLAQQNLLDICKKRDIILNRGQLKYLTYILLSKWENLISDMYYNFNRSKLLVFSHYNLVHAANLSKELSSELNRSVSIEVFSEPTFKQEALKNYEFDILLSTCTMAIDIEQPVIYLKRINNYLDIQYFKEIIDSTIQMNKKRFRDKIKNEEDLAIKSL